MVNKLPPRGSKSRIAAELGISPAAVTKLAARGMPVDDADAARRWRQRHLAAGRMRPDPGPSPETLLRRCQSAVDLAAAALERHMLHLVADDLRAAMRSVPASHRAQLVMPFALWGSLIGAYAMALMAEGSAGGGDESTPADAAAARDDDDPGRVAYALACGEARIR